MIREGFELIGAIFLLWILGVLAIRIYRFLRPKVSKIFGDVWRAAEKKHAYLSGVPPRLRWLVAVVFVVIVSGPVAVTLYKPIESYWEANNAPDLELGVVSAATIDTMGKPSVLHEFEFNRVLLAHSVVKDSDLDALFLSESVPIYLPECDDGKIRPGLRLFEIPIFVANVGEKTARQFQITITFSRMPSYSEEIVRRLDPGVRIVRVETDAMYVSYVDQQEPDLSVDNGCTADGVTPTRSGNQEGKPGGNDTAKGGGDPYEKTDERARQAYKRLGLTRDGVMLKADLEAHEFQAIVLIVQIPEDSRSFAILYKVECETCKFFVRTTSFAQVLQPWYQPSPVLKLTAAAPTDARDRSLRAARQSVL